MPIENDNFSTAKLHIPTGLKSRKQLFNEEFEWSNEFELYMYDIGRGSMNLKSRYLKKFNEYAVGDLDSSSGITLKPHYYSLIRESFLNWNKNW